MIPLDFRRLILLFGLFLLVGCCAFWVLHWNTEEYAVCDAAIREVFSGEHVSYYLILDTTQPASRFGISSFHSRELNLPFSAKASYTAKNVFHFQIPPRFHLPHPFTMVGQKDLDVVYAPGQLDDPKADELKGLLGRSWGVITLSRVGFDHTGTHAVVYAQLTYCGLCGEGTYLHLSKQTGTWHVVSRAGTWIS
jgi:hypothetical protein